MQAAQFCKDYREGVDSGVAPHRTWLLPVRAHSLLYTSPELALILLLAQNCRACDAHQAEGQDKRRSFVQRWRTATAARGGSAQVSPVPPLLMQSEDSDALLCSEKPGDSSQGAVFEGGINEEVKAAVLHLRRIVQARRFTRA